MRILKPWGYEEVFAVNEFYAGKVLYIKAGERLSLQYHKRKRETMYVWSGKAYLTIEKIKMIISGGAQPVNISPGIKHRLEAIEDTVIFEVSTTELDDVVRLEDNYGRVT